MGRMFGQNVLRREAQIVRHRSLLCEQDGARSALLTDVQDLGELLDSRRDL
jgi:hypothetical protein